MTDKINSETLKTAYGLYIGNAQSLFDFLNVSVQRWDGAKQFDRTIFTEYNINTYYKENKFPTEGLRGILSESFDNLGMSIRKVRDTLEEINPDTLEDMDIINNYSAELKKLHSDLIINDIMYFGYKEFVNDPRNDGLATVTDESLKIKKEIEKVRNIQIGMLHKRNN